MKKVLQPLGQVLVFVPGFLQTFEETKTSNIGKTCPCNIQRFVLVEKIENFVGKILIFFLFLLKT